MTLTTLPPEVEKADGGRLSQAAFEKAFAEDVCKVYLDNTTRAIFGRGWDAALNADRERVEELVEAFIEEYPLCAPEAGCGKCNRLRPLIAKFQKGEKGK